MKGGEPDVRFKENLHRSSHRNKKEAQRSIDLRLKISPHKVKFIESSNDSSE
jgi:hypothetical protein